MSAAGFGKEIISGWLQKRLQGIQKPMMTLSPCSAFLALMLAWSEKMVDRRSRGHCGDYRKLLSNGRVCVMEATLLSFRKDATMQLPLECHSQPSGIDLTERRSY